MRKLITALALAKPACQRRASRSSQPTPKGAAPAPAQTMPAAPADKARYVAQGHRLGDGQRRTTDRFREGAPRGNLTVSIGAYPLTFRLMGPNNNEFLRPPGTGSSRSASAW